MSRVDVGDLGFLREIITESADERGDTGRVGVARENCTDIGFDGRLAVAGIKREDRLANGTEAQIGKDASSDRLVGLESRRKSVSAVFGKLLIVSKEGVVLFLKHGAVGVAIIVARKIGVVRDDGLNEPGRIPLETAVTGL